MTESRRKNREFLENTVSLFQEGNFYEAYGNDALVLADITGYRAKALKDGTPRTGFSVKAIEAVCRKLGEASVSYSIRKDAKILIEHDVGTDNRYGDFGHSVQTEPYYQRPVKDGTLHIPKASPAVLSIPGKETASVSGNTGPRIYRLTALMPLIMDHGEPSTLYDWGSDIEFLFPDGYIYRLSK